MFHTSGFKSKEYAALNARVEITSSETKRKHTQRKFKKNKKNLGFKPIYKITYNFDFGSDYLK